MKKGESKEAPALIGTTKLAALLMLTPRWVQKLTKEGTLEKYGDGPKYDRDKAIQDYIRSIKSSIDRNDLGEARRRQAMAGATLAEIEVAEKAGELVSAADMKAAVERQFSEVRSKLLSLPSKAPAALLLCETERELSAALADLVNDCLVDLAPQTRRAPRRRRSSVAAAAAQDDKPVGGRRKAPKSGVGGRAGKVANV